MTRTLAALLLLAAATAWAAPADRAAAQSALAALAANGPLTVLWPAGADTPRHVSGPLQAARAGTPEAVARGFLRQSGALFAVRDAAAELRTHAAVATAAGTAVRFTQQHLGLEVYGAHLVVLVDPRGRVVLANSSLHAAGPALPAALIDDALARGAVAARGAQPGRARLVWLPVGDELRAVWVVWGRTLQPFGVFDYLVDAQSGAVVGRRNRLFTVKGRVYDISPNEGAGLLDVDLPHLTSTTTLTGDYADSYRGTINPNTYALMTADRKAVPVNGDYLYDPVEPSFTEPFAEVQTYYHVTIFHQWMVDQFQFQRTTRGGDQFITTYANVAYSNGSGGVGQFDNAFCGDITGDGKDDLALGQGSVDYSYDAEVIYHEFTHSMVGEGPKLDGYDLDAVRFNVDPLGLNEGFADYFSCTYTGDPNLGEYAGEASGGGTIRQLVDGTGELMQCRDVPLMGESHDDSMPWSRGLWDVRTALGADKADKAIWAALHTLAPSATFGDAATSLIAAVQQLYGSGDAATVKGLMDARNLTECPPLFELHSGDQRQGYVFGNQGAGNLQLPHSLQYFVQVPANATRLTFSARGQGAMGGRATLIPLVRKTDPVLVQQNGYSVTYQADVTGAANKDVVLTPDSTTAPLVPGETYYLLITNAGSDDMIFDLSVALSTTPVQQHDGGVADAAPHPDAGRPDGQAGDGGVNGDGGSGPGPSRGCSCRAGTGSAGPALAVLLVLGLALLRRRRR